MRLLVKPEADSYQVSFGQTALRQELDGGRGRYRRDILNASKIVEMTWSLDESEGEYTYFMAFYREQAKEGAEPFEMFLIIDEGTEVECVCNFIPGSAKLNSQSGMSYIVSASVEVRPPINPTQSADDQDVIDDFNTAHGYTP